MTEEPGVSAVLPPTGIPRPPHGLVFGALFRADVVVLLHNRVSGFVGLLVPLVIVVATSFGTRAARIGGPEEILALALTIGIVTSSLLGYAIGLAQDRDAGILQRLRVTPAPTWVIMGSRILVQVVANLVVSVIVVVVGSILHGLAPDALQYASALALVVLGAAMFLSLGQVLVGLLNSMMAVSAVGRVLFVVLLLLGLLGVSGILGDTMKAIGDWSPIGSLMALFSGVFTREAFGSQEAYALLACVGYTIVFAFIGIRYFRWNGR